ncbi:hypothetical protein D3C76_675350 [compost metagenome]
MQGADDLPDGFAALHGGRDQRQLDLRGAAAEYTDDVADHRTGGGADDADALRMSRQRNLAVGAEQAFGTELFLQGIEGQAQCTVTGGLDGVENQLVVATALEQRDLASHFHRQAVFERLAHPRCILPEQGTTHLGAAVLEGEIHVAGGGAGEVGNLAFDPDAAEHVFEQHPRTAVELADGEDFAVETEALEGVFNHGVHDKGIGWGISIVVNLEFFIVFAGLIVGKPAPT